MIKAIDHLVINTDNFLRCREFYGGLLKMECRYNNGRYEFLFGKNRIDVHQKAGDLQPAAMYPTPGSMALCLEIDENLEAVYKDLLANNAPLLTDIVKRTGAKGNMRSIYLRDPDGNLIELSEYE